MTMSHVEQLRNLKPARESDGAPTSRKELNGSSRSATYANERGKPVSYTQAAEATTNNDNDNEPRRTTLNMKPARESDGTPTPRKKLNGSISRILRHNTQTEAASPSRTHTPTKSFQQINGRRRQAHRMQELST